MNKDQMEVEALAIVGDIEGQNFELHKVNKLLVLVNDYMTAFERDFDLYQREKISAKTFIDFIAEGFEGSRFLLKDCTIELKEIHEEMKKQVRILNDMRMSVSDS